MDLQSNLIESIGMAWCNNHTRVVERLAILDLFESFEDHTLFGRVSARRYNHRSLSIDAETYAKFIRHGVIESGFSDVELQIAGHENSFRGKT